MSTRHPDRTAWIAPRLARMTLAEACSAHADGTLSVDEYEAYRHAWAVSAPEGYRNALGWMDPPESPEAREVAAAILAEVERDAARTRHHQQEHALRVLLAPGSRIRA